jgi:hypothetical protein
MVEDDGGQTLEELNTLQAKRQLDRLYNNTSNASLDVEGDSNGSEEYLEGGEEVALDTSIDKSEMLRGDGNGSEDEAEHMFDDKDNDISAAWEEQNGTDQMSDNEDDDISVAWEKQNKEGLDGQDVGQDSKCIASHLNPWKETDIFKGFGHLPTIRGGGKQHLDSRNLSTSGLCRGFLLLLIPMIYCCRLLTPLNT